MSTCGTGLRVTLTTTRLRARRALDTQTKTLRPGGVEASKDGAAVKGMCGWRRCSTRRGPPTNRDDRSADVLSIDRGRRLTSVNFSSRWFCHVLDNARPDETIPEVGEGLQ